MTNLEKIKAMSIDEMAEFICGLLDTIDFFSCEEKVEAWLSSKAE